MADELSIEQLEAKKKRLLLEQEIRELEGGQGWSNSASIRVKPVRTLRQLQREIDKGKK